MLVDLEFFYLGHLKNFYTIQYTNTLDRVSLLVMTHVDELVAH